MSLVVGKPWQWKLERAGHTMSIVGKQSFLEIKYLLEIWVSSLSVSVCLFCVCLSYFLIQSRILAHGMVPSTVDESFYLI